MILLAALVAAAVAAADLRGIYLYTEHPENATDMQQLLSAMQVPGVEYDQIVELIEWSDTVVAW